MVLSADTSGLGKEMDFHSTSNVLESDGATADEARDCLLQCSVDTWIII